MTQKLTSAVGSVWSRKSDQLQFMVTRSGPGYGIADLVALDLSESVSGARIMGYNQSDKIDWQFVGVLVVPFPQDARYLINTDNTVPRVFAIRDIRGSLNPETFQADIHYTFKPPPGALYAEYEDIVAPLIFSHQAIVDGHVAMLPKVEYQKPPFVMDAAYRIEYHDVESLVQQTYGLEYSLPADMEASNDSTLTVDTTDALFDFERDDLAEALQDQFAKEHRILNVLMTDMARRGVIPNGRYIVNVSW